MGTSHYGTEVDIWSVGCILIELLTRKIAFQVGSTLTVAVRDSEIPPKNIFDNSMSTWSVTVQQQQKLNIIKNKKLNEFQVWTCFFNKLFRRIMQQINCGLSIDCLESQTTEIWHLVSKETFQNFFTWIIKIFRILKIPKNMFFAKTWKFINSKFSFWNWSCWISDWTTLWTLRVTHVQHSTDFSFNDLFIEFDLYLKHIIVRYIIF